MTGFKSKKAAAQDEEGMYLVHHTKGRTFDRLGNKIHEEDDDTQVYGDSLTIAYQSGYYDGKKAAQRPWVELTDDELADIWYKESLDWMEFARAVLAKSKERNT